MKKRYFGMAMPRINVEDARTIPIPIAPFKEQLEIVRRIDVNGNRQQAAFAAVNQALDDINYLNQAILAKAFRGGLVPQDPADEPASVLLERIRASKSETLGNGKQRRKARQ